MTATDETHRPVARSGRPWVGSAVIGGVALLAVAGLMFGLPPGSSGESPSATASAPASAAAGPTATPAATRNRASPSPPVASATPSSSPRLTPAATPRPSPTRHPRAAPASANDFDLEAQAIVIGFPLRPTTRYRYRDNFLDLRDGFPDPYNHARHRNGSLVRAHDGIDIYTRAGEPVLAPFDGVVLDPADRFQPWESERYGSTAVIISSAPTSEGYAALLAHLDRLWVEPGQQVRQGEVIGTVGNTGNAEGVRPHLHLELRAPFLLSWEVAGVPRPVDAFNPYPSLVAADPDRQP